MKINCRSGLNRLLATATLLLTVTSFKSTVFAASVNLQPSDSLLEEIQQIDVGTNFTQVYARLVVDFTTSLEGQGVDPQIISQMQQALFNLDADDTVDGLSLLGDVLDSLSEIRLQGNSDASVALTEPIDIDRVEAENLFLGIYTFEPSPETIDNRNRIRLGSTSIPLFTETGVSLGSNNINLVQPGLAGVILGSDNINLVQPGLAGVILGSDNINLIQPGITGASIGSDNVNFIRPQLFTSEESTLTRNARDFANLSYDLRSKAAPEAQMSSAIRVELPNIYQLRELDMEYAELDLTINVPVMPKVELATALGTDPRRQLKTQQQEMMEEYERKVNSARERQQQRLNDTLGNRLEQQKAAFNQQF